MFIEEVLVAVAEYETGTRLSAMLRFAESVEKWTGNDLCGHRSIPMKCLSNELIQIRNSNQNKTGTGIAKSNNNTPNPDSSAEDDSDDEEEQKEAHDEVSRFFIESLND